MRRWCVLAILVWTTLAPSAFAQNPNLIGPSGRPDVWSDSTATNDNWGRCAQGDRNDAERALRSCGRIIGERNSGDITAAALYFRGRLYELLRDPRATEDYEEAYRWFSIALGSQRRNPHAYANRAAVLYRLGRFDEAIADYRAAIEATDRFNAASGTRTRAGLADLYSGQVANYHHRIGGIYFRMGDWPSAIDAFDRAAALSPEEAYLFAARCEVRAAAHVELDVASAACEQALHMDGEDSYNYFSRGFLRFMAGDFEVASADFYAAVERDATNYLALYALGVTGVRLGHREVGEAMIARAREDLPNSVIDMYQAVGLRR